MKRFVSLLLTLSLLVGNLPPIAVYATETEITAPAVETIAVTEQPDPTVATIEAETAAEEETIQTIATEATTAQEELTNSTESNCPPTEEPEATEEISESAARATLVDSGYCGEKILLSPSENLYYELYSDGTLVITGTGVMCDVYDDLWNYGGVKITNIQLPYGLTHIGTAAFASCDIKSIHIPGSVQSIGLCAFYDCQKLEEINIPEGVTVIGGAAFANCTYLKKATLPSTVVELSSELFEGCSYLEEVVLPGGLRAIWSQCFQNCYSLEELYLPETLKYIDYLAFSHCTALKKIQIPENVTEIGFEAFYNCDALEEIVIPGSVNYLGTAVFAWCDKLKKVTISDGITELPHEIFMSCVRLREVVLSSNLKSIGDKCFDSCYDLEKIKLPNTLETIGKEAFEFSGIKEIEIPKSVISIGQYAFSYCNNLKKVFIAAKINELPYWGFAFCETLQEVILPEGLSVIDERCFLGCKKLRQIVLPNSLKTIRMEAFWECQSLPQIVIPDSVTHVGEKAFFNCIALRTATLSDGMSVIPYSMFEGCHSLTEVILPSQLEDLGNRCFYGCKTLTKIVLPDTLESIGNAAFAGCEALAQIDLPDSVESIGGSAFSSCATLESIILPSSVTVLGEYAFSFCNNLKSAIINAEISDLPDCLFMQCANLEEVVLPEYLETIGGFNDYDDECGSFAYCDSLSSIDLPETLVIIGKGAFVGCESLTEITIPKNVYDIGSNAFGRCKNLKKIIFVGNAPVFVGNKGNHFTQVTATAFYPKGDPSWTESVMQNYGGNITWVPYNTQAGHFYHGSLECSLSMDGTLTIYGNGEMKSEATAADYPWNKFKNEINYLIIEPGVSTIGQYAFQDFTKLKTVSLTGSLCRIEENAFSGCSNLSSASYPATKQEFDARLQVMDGNEELTKALRFVENIEDVVGNNNITIHYSGNATAYYQTAPNVEVSYKTSYHVDGKTVSAVGAVYSDENGVVKIPLGFFNKTGRHDVTVVFSGIGGELYESEISMTAVVHVTPLEFSQSWEMKMEAKGSVGLSEGVGGKIGALEAKAELASIDATANVGSVMNVTRNYSGGKNSLEVTSDRNLGLGVEVGSGIYAEGGGAKLDVISAGLEVNGSAVESYGIRIDDFNYDGKQLLALGTYFLGESLVANPCSTYYVPLYRYLTEKYAYDKLGCTVVSGFGTKVAGNANAGLGQVEVNDKDLFSGVKGEFKTSMSQMMKYSSKGEYEKTTSAQLDTSLAALTTSREISSGLKKDLLGKDIEIKGTASSDGKSLAIKSLIEKENTWDWDFSLKEKKTAEYITSVIKDDSPDGPLNQSPAFSDYLKNPSIFLSTLDMVQMAIAMAEWDLPTQYSEEQQHQRLYTIPDVGIGASLGLKAELDVALSYMEKIGYTTGYGYNGIITGASDENALKEQVDGKTFVVEEVITDYAIPALKEYVKLLYNTVVGVIEMTIEAGKALIKGIQDSIYNWAVSLTVPNSGFTGSYSCQVKAIQQTSQMTANGISSVAVHNFDTVATIGDTILVAVQDLDTGMDVTDLSDEPLTLILRYDEADLEAAGLTKESAVVLDGGIAMYRYSDEGDFYEFVGGENDLAAMTVTAQIVKPGQYVLAADSCAPQLSSLNLSDFREMPTITARIDDLSGLDVSKFVFKLDGAVKVDRSNVSQYLNSKTGLFTYAVTEALAEGEHTMSFTLADTTGNAQTYEYTFRVDLTAPTISEATVSGYTNAGAAVEIRANAADVNLTSVMALLSKRLPDGTWTTEVGAEMGNMGDGAWGLDYEGDGSSLKVRVCATDVAGNQTFSEVFEVKPYVESIEIEQDYLALRVGQTKQLTADVQPAELAGSLTWQVEEGGNAVSVENGTVTAKAPGTAWIVATATDGEKEVTARCRIDVADSLVLEGVKLGTSQVTTEVYSTQYPKLDMLLLLPQNYSASAEGEGQTEKLSAAISEAYFTDEVLRNLFSLNVLDDRTVEIIPTAAAISGAKLAKSYTGTITVMVEGRTYETDFLTLNIKTSLPKLKVTVPAFNAFYSGSSQEIQVTGATVTGISAEALPEWLTLNGTELTLTGSAPKKSASAKVSLEIMTEEWAVPVSVVATIKCNYKAPGLKLSTSSVQISDQAGSSSGIQLQLVPSNKKESLNDLKVLGITAPMGYSIENYENGTFTLKTESGFIPGKINLEVSFSNTAETVKLPVTVKAVQTKLKLDKTSINLNGEIGDSAVIGITATPADYILTAPSFRLVDKAGSDKLNSGELDVRFENGTVRISTTAKTEIGTNYTLYVKAGGSKEATAKIKIVGGVPSVSLKQTKDLDLSFAEPAIITASFKNYAGGKIESFTYTVAETKSGFDATNQFEMEEKNGQVHLTCTEPSAVNEKGTYVLNLKLTLADGEEYEASLKLKIKRTAIKLKLSASNLTMNKAVGDAASISVTCTTKGYEFTKPVWQLMDKSGKQPMEGKLDIRWVDGKLRIATNTSTEFGATYKLLISAAEGAAATALTISIPAENKSNITATIKAKGNLDVIRSGAVIVTPSYKNCLADTAKTEELIVIRSDGQAVTDQFDIVKNTDGTYAVSIAKGAEIDMSKKYQLQLVAKFGTMEVSAKPIVLNIKMGSAKLIAETEGTLFSKDKHSRMNLRFTSADAALNGVARVEIKDAKQAEIFEVFDYGNGEFAIGFKNGKTLASAKPITLTLDVYLSGNTSAKPNAILKLKLSIAP